MGKSTSSVSCGSKDPDSQGLGPCRERRGVAWGPGRFHKAHQLVG